MEAVSANGTVRILRKGISLLEGEERNGSLHLRFTEHSGAEAEFEIAGAVQQNGLNWSGVCNVNLGGLALPNATVRVTKMGIEIVAAIEWAGEQATARFESGTTSGQWHGRLETREALPCLITRREMLRTSITMELDAHEGSSTCTALAVLEGRNIKVPTVTEPHCETNTFFLRYRQKTLGAVREYLMEELAVCEEELAAAVDSDEDGAEATTDARDVAHYQTDDSNAALAAAVRRYESEFRPSTHGYLPPVSEAAPSPAQRSKVTIDGYLDHRRLGRATIAQGYLPASSGEKQIVTGYLPNLRAAERSAGYLPGESRAATVQPLSTGGTSNEDDSDGRSTAPRDIVNSPVDFPRIAYTVLRCKDLLAALEIAESREPGA